MPACLDRCGGGRGARTSAARDHRPVAGRRTADGVGVRPVRHLLSTARSTTPHELARRNSKRAGAAFRGHSDTEVMVEGFAVWGVEATVERLIGMFAIALWDRARAAPSTSCATASASSRSIGPSRRRLLFGSELKALRAHPGWTPALDRDALAAFLRFGYVPAPRTIYRGVHKLPPGTILDACAAGEPTHHGLIGRCGRRARGARPHRSPGRRGRGRRRARALLRDAVAAAHGRRRAARRLSVGRHRFIDGRRADAGAKHATGAHLLDRLPRAGLQRGRAAPRGRRASRHRAHRALR